MLSTRELGNLGNNGAAARAVANYFKDCYADYYVKGLDENYAGDWIGSGAQRLHLTGAVDKETLQLALTGTIDGGSVQNVGKPDRQMGWDLTFSAPKSVSIVWAFADRDHKDEIIKAHKDAVEKAYTYLQNKITTRRGKGSKIKELTQVVAAHFVHFTSREGDPQLHSHLVIPNFSIRKDGTVGAIESQILYTHKMTAGALYQSQFAMNIKELGYEVERGVTGTFRLKHVPQSIEKTFSKRSSEIQAMADKLGIDSYIQERGIVIMTRPEKEYTTISEREKAWSKEIAELKLNTDFHRAEKAIASAKPDHRKNLTNVALKLTENRSTFEEKDIIRALAIEYQGQVGIKDLARAYDVFVQSKEIILLGKTKRDRLVYTTEEMVILEDKVINLTTELLEKKSPKVEQKYIDNIPKGISDEIRTSIKSAFNDQSSIIVIQGRAGSGKTTMLNPIMEGFRQSGIEVSGVAYTGKAAQQMKKSSNLDSKTIDSWLSSDDIKKGSVLIVDEAGMVGTRKMHKLLDKAEYNDLKVILVGDENQLQPIEPGGTLHLVDRHILQRAPECSSQINTIRRQNHEWMRDAVHAAALGQSDIALKIMNKHDLIDIFENPKTAREQLVRDYLKTYKESPFDSAVLSHDNLQTHIINKEVRQKLLDSGQVGEKGIIFNTEKMDIELATGDNIIFTRNNYTIDVRNGQRGMIEQISQLNKTITVKLEDGKERKFSQEECRDVNYGWAMTTHKAQGLTVEKAFVYGFSGEWRATKNSTYVQISRAKEETKLYIVGGQHSLELETQSNEEQLDLFNQEKVFKSFVKQWNKEGSKLSAHQVSKTVEMAQEHEKFIESKQLLELGLEHDNFE